MRIVTAEQMRQAEASAVCGGLSYLRLMENAGAACVSLIRRHYGIKIESGMHVAVVCGHGNNGGDGYVIARKLSQSGCRVTVLSQTREPKGAAAEMFARLADFPVSVVYTQDTACDIRQVLSGQSLLVDALFGTGFKGELSIETARLIQAMNDANTTRVSVDIPSGLSCDSGSLPAFFVQADYTVAIAACKPVHVLQPAAARCGIVEIARIGLEETDFQHSDKSGIFTQDITDLRPLFHPRDPLAHKGDFGHVLCICGSKQMQGAAVLAAKAAVQSGAGLVTAAFPDAAYSAIAPKLTEPLLLPLPSNSEGTLSVKALPSLLNAAKKADAVLLGCGIGWNRDTIMLVKELVANCTKPMVLDADGINALSRDIDIVQSGNAPRLLTPHPGEMARLTGQTPHADCTQRIRSAKDFAKKYGVTLVLKGANTVVAPPRGERVYLNTSGNPGLATGGSGDMLAGMLVSLLAQFLRKPELTPFDAAVSAVYLHGRSGDLAVQELSQHCVTPTACLAQLPYLFKQLE